MFRLSKGKFFLIILLGLLWWWMKRPQMESVVEKQPAMIPLPEKPREPASGKVSVDAAPTPKTKTAAKKPGKKMPDDFRKIYGIGPKTNAALHAAGITNFSQLSQMDESQIKDALAGTGAQTANSDTWSEQASLAAAEKWDALEKLQQLIRNKKPR